jgi:hypothetical protein
VTRPPDEIVRRALALARDEVPFAQVVTLDVRGYPVARTATAFLADDWSVALVHRRTHARLAQVTRDPRVLVVWTGAPADDATNEHPHVFDVGALPPRAVMVRGTAQLADDTWTEATYRRHLDAQRAAGHTRAPVRDADQVRADLVGLRVRPFRVRLEGFGAGAQSFDWTAGPPLDPTDPDDHDPHGGQR